MAPVDRKVAEFSVFGVVGNDGEDVEDGVVEHGEKDEENVEEAPPLKQSKEDFCRCTSKCSRKPYCKSKARSALCRDPCHPTSTKCTNV